MIALSPHDDAVPEVVDALGGVTGLWCIKVKDLLLFENLAFNYFMLTALHSVDKVSNEQQIFGLIVVRERGNCRMDILNPKDGVQTAF